MKHLLVLNVSPELEDDLVDYLMSREEQSGFTSYPVRGHGEHGQLTIAEQVSGRRKRIQFELMLDEAIEDEILAELVEQVGTDITFWVQPVIRSGRLKNDSSII